MITVYINFSELPSWLALAPLRSLVADQAISITWQPMLRSLGNLVNSNLKPGEEDPLAEYKARRAAARHKAAKRENERMCEMLGITPEQGMRDVDPLYLSLGLLWIEQQQPDAVFDYIEFAYQQSFSAEAQVESVTDIADLIRTMGLKADDFADYAAENKALVEASREQTLDSGILNAPAFVLDGEVFHGREHLPLIRWMLSGKQGTPPV